MVEPDNLVVDLLRKFRAAQVEVRLTKRVARLEKKK